MLLDVDLELRTLAMTVVAVLSLNGSSCILNAQDASLNLIVVAIHMGISLVGNTRVLLWDSLGFSTDVALILSNRHSLVLGGAVLSGLSLRSQKRLLSLFSLLSKSIVVVLVAEVSIKILSNQGSGLGLRDLHLLGAISQLLLAGCIQLLGSVVLGVSGGDLDLLMTDLDRSVGDTKGVIRGSIVLRREDIG